jgi:hypothetical protein
LNLKNGLFPELENLAMIRNYNMAVNSASYDYSNLSLKEDGETWAGFGDDSNLIKESSLGKANGPGPNATTSYIQ